MINKRSFADDNSFEVAPKHPRHRANQHVPAGGNIAPQKSFEGDGNFNKYPYGGKDLITNAAKETKEPGNCGSGSSPHYLWVNSSIIDADFPTSHLSFFPEYFEHTDNVRVLLESDDVHASPVDHPPQKLVPVGPEYQAHVPQWDQQGSSSSDHQIELFDLCHGINAHEEKMGIGVNSMPKSDVPFDYCSEEEVSRDDCRCLDKGSIGCVRQHVMGAREKLREEVGPKQFEDLGFCEMGEGVAKKWTEEEEQIFHEVILANPVSLGRNFWDHLSTAFPTRTHMDLVSYYFNVFMLRKRAGQNRFDPLNIDSDNDEWQQNELAVVEDDDDSVVESPTDQEAPIYYREDHAEDFHEDLGDTNDADACEDGAAVVYTAVIDENDAGDTDDGLRTCMKDSPSNYCNSRADTFGKSHSDNREDYDVQDDSCTSYEYQRDRIEVCCPLDDRSRGTDARDCRVG